MCERVERVALADRAAGRVDNDDRPADPATYLESFRLSLEADPTQSPEARVDRRVRELMEA